jgi:hypothetical protein
MEPFMFENRKPHTEGPAERDPLEVSMVKEAREDREEIKRLRDALETIASGTEDIFPPFRAMPRENMQNIARIALRF